MRKLQIRQEKRIKLDDLWNQNKKTPIEKNRNNTRDFDFRWLKEEKSQNSWFEAAKANHESDTYEFTQNTIQNIPKTQETQTNTDISYIRDLTEPKMNSSYFDKKNEISPWYHENNSNDFSTSNSLWRSVLDKSPGSLRRLKENLSSNREKTFVINKSMIDKLKSPKDYAYAFTEENNIFKSSIIRTKTHSPKMTPSYSVSSFEFPKLPRKYRPKKSKRSSRFEFLSVPKKFYQSPFQKEKKMLILSMQRSVRRL